MLGTAWWMILLTAGSAAGLNMPSAVAASLLVHALAFAVVLIRRRHLAFRPRRNPRAWLCLLAPLLVAGLVGMLPVLHTE